MRVLFVDNLLIEHNESGPRFDLQPHLGLLSLLAVAESGGHEALLYDPKLELTRGSYKSVAQLFNVPQSDYKRLLNFLRKYECHLPIRDFRALPVQLPDLPRRKHKTG